MKKILLILMLGMFLISLTSATPDFFVKQGEAHNIRFECRDTTQPLSICSVTTTCNITVAFPNTTLFIDNQNATNEGNGFFNYSLTSSQTQVFGEYDGRVGCSSATLNSSSTFVFEINLVGKELTTGQAIIYFLFLLVLMGVFCFALYYSITIPFRNVRNENEELISINDVKYLKILAIVISYLTLMTIFAMMTGITESFISITGASKVFHWMYIFMLSFVYPIIVVSLLVALIMFIRDKIDKKKIERWNPFTR